MSILRPGRAGIGAFCAGAAIAAYRKRNTNASTDALNTTSFTPFTLHKKEAVSSTSSIFSLSSTAASRETYQDLWIKGVWSLQIKQPQLQIARAYTPLPPSPPSESAGQDDDLRLLVRRERNGEVSNYVHRTEEGGALELRGPMIEYELPKDVDEVLFLAGGTGIAPALQVAYALQGKARMAIMWANRNREDCLGGESDNPVQGGGGWLSLPSWLGFGSTAGESVKSAESESMPVNAVVRQLEQIKSAYNNGQSHGSLQVDYFVDEEKSFISPSSIKTLRGINSTAQDTSRTKLLIVSGPEGFVNYWAGPKQWSNGKEVQGPLGGVLGQMQLQGDWTVVKL